MTPSTAPFAAGETVRRSLGVVARAERNEPPFSEQWPQWRPDPAWELPALPVGWERLQR